MSELNKIDPQRAFQKIHQCRDYLNKSGDEMDLAYQTINQLKHLVKDAYGEGYYEGRKKGSDIEHEYKWNYSDTKEELKKLV